MSRHVIDRRATTEGGRVKNFLQLDRATIPAEGSHAAVRQLHQRPETREGTARIRNFLRIEKGWTA